MDEAALVETYVNDLPGAKLSKANQSQRPPVITCCCTSRFKNFRTEFNPFMFLSSFQHPKTLLPHMDCSALQAQKPFTDEVTSLTISWNQDTSRLDSSGWTQVQFTGGKRSKNLFVSWPTGTRCLYFSCQVLFFNRKTQIGAFHGNSRLGFHRAVKGLWGAHFFECRSAKGVV